MIHFGHFIRNKLSLLVYRFIFLDFEPLKWVYENAQNGDSFIQRTAEKTWLLVENGETLGEYNEESFELDENGSPVVILWQFINEDQTDMLFLLVKEGEVLYGFSKDSINEFFVKGKWEVTITRKNHSFI